MSIRENLEEVKGRIAAACARAGRSPAEVTLIGVTKTKSAEVINQGIDCGITDIGENRVQELLEKYDAIQKGVKIHLIGHLQTNKVKYILDMADLIHSVDSEKLADEISRLAAAKQKTAEVLVQVNVSGEESKSGVAPERLDALLGHIARLPAIRVSGLMTIPPLDSGNMETTRGVFRALHKIFVDKQAVSYDNITMRHLSMGMSNDFEIAVEEGATMVRVGRAIFGER